MINADVVVAYTLCNLKAFYLLFSDKSPKPKIHEYVALEKHNVNKNRMKYFRRLKKDIPELKPYSTDNMKKGVSTLFNINLLADDLVIYIDAIIKSTANSNNSPKSYIPVLVIGTHKITKEQKIELAFIGHVLSKIQKERPSNGIIISADNKTHKIKLNLIYKELELILKSLKRWVNESEPTPPPIILNKNCSICSFKNYCEKISVEKDDLSLLNRIGLKQIKKYQKKGIFTVNQLSYLFKPRKQRKSKKKKKILFNYRPELQALAIRKKKIYIQELPDIPINKIGLYLDIEGIPDQNFFYLIGLLVIKNDVQQYFSFWADSLNDEKKIWIDFGKKIIEYPGLPIYHYGSYDSRAINQLAGRYGHIEDLENRLINMTSYIYGKIYFPVTSNELKKLGTYIGATWTHSEASGLKSLVWRHYWEQNNSYKYQQILLTYNKEDCNALYLLLTKLLSISETASSNLNIDFADQPKKHATTISNQIHDNFEQVLQYAHADYDKNKISSKLNKNEISKKNKKRYKRKVPKENKCIRVPVKRKCVYCSVSLIVTEQVKEHVVTDLVFTKNGFRKTIIKYIGKRSVCPKCHRSYIPKIISDFQQRCFGHTFIAWTIYQRIILRLPFRIILQTMSVFFNTGMSETTLINWMKYFAKYYDSTEKIIIKNILKSPVIYADETKINIQGENHYVWVFTDGKNVTFKITETRESKIVHDFLSDYDGILISDFYPGYDSVHCRQQKCWVHLVRNINDDLWKEPFNEEFEKLVLAVKELIVPILNTVRKYGSKKRHLNKYRKTIDIFYNQHIDHSIYTFEVTSKYQKRFQRYKNSLFTFMEGDGIPWNNNMAERAIRQLAVQRKISGTFYKNAVPHYLLLLSISQTCRFQGKDFLRFLISKERNIDTYKTPKLTQYSELI